ncbi:hypothetical protein B0H16DRAFT_1794176 [Mycena metata]|uniref:Uncharacterized protein n=1 Tax=Mycena metata TaxID=1033252 RepID=A0AAD7HG14_9AGAR|nr:hypothetical protein B0H16DRAFT_1794176 [Mycena metata]
MGIPRLPDDQLVSPPPAPEYPKVLHFYGYKLYETFDETNDEDMERVGKISGASVHIPLHSHVVSKPNGVLVFLALHDPELGIITPRSGCSKVPYKPLLDKFEAELGINAGPAWFPEDGLIFRPGYTARDYAKSIEPLWWKLWRPYQYISIVSWPLATNFNCKLTLIPVLRRPRNILAYDNVPTEISSREARNSSTLPHGAKNGS